MNNKAFIFSLILFSFVYITKQILFLILLFIFVYLLFNKQTRKLSPFLLFAYILREITHLTYFQGVPKDHHISQINLIDTFFDLILLRNLKFENIKSYYKTYLWTYLLLICSSYLLFHQSLFLFNCKNLNNVNTIFRKKYISKYCFCIFTLYFQCGKIWNLNPRLDTCIVLFQYKLFLYF